jgi:hypothetical protein
VRGAAILAGWILTASAALATLAFWSKARMARSFRLALALFGKSLAISILIDALGDGSFFAFTRRVLLTGQAGCLRDRPSRMGRRGSAKTRVLLDVRSGLV